VAPRTRDRRAAAATLAGLATPLAQNAWSVATGRGYFVPDESSWSAFRVTRENDGSGEWWLAGEDERHYFVLHPHDAVYLVVSREAAARCAGFDPCDAATWCEAQRVPLPR